VAADIDKVPRLSADELAELIRTKKAGSDYLLVDVRRTDFSVSSLVKPQRRFKF
jgi:hypothetical protein